MADIAKQHAGAAVADPAAPAQPRRKRLGRLLLVLLVLGVGVDAMRSPERQWTAAAEIAAIHLYRANLSPLLARGGVHCRFTPTCSRYAEAVIRRDGALVGTARALWRVLRCGPWTPAGSVDPP